MLFRVIAIVVALMVMHSFRNTGTASNQEVIDLHQQKVVLYATSWCGYCRKARDLLNKNQVPFQEYDIESSAEGNRQHKALGGKGVPVLLINGEVVHGYNQAKILSLLDSV